ncbi:isochorismatase family protein [Kibdelosporangium aridum]|uniref:Isochorismate hydrolase n=1 Tax=Kibdelosporangium aridum TaxID=2030 RepID=A0A1Y5Y7I2_KIBAR|nr:isochorismatase family protein [Kibdelosporangium aridum]SMD25870.1 Isochorismate hydrolase [Kibdelosporangium aridum]
MAGIPQIEPYPLPGATELPGNIASWVAEPDRAVLLVHDMQRYFLRPLPGPLLTQLVANIARLRDHCAALGIPVAYTAQPGGMTEQQRGLLKDFWGPGMGTDPADRDVLPELAPAPDDWLLTKWRYSAFFGGELLRLLREHERDQLIVCGVYAHVGVLATAIDAFTHDIQPFLAADALADFSAEEHRMALAYGAQRCAVVGTTGQLISQLDAASPVSAGAGGPGRTAHDG